MLLPLQGRRLYYDLTGPEAAPTICITHSLAHGERLISAMWCDTLPESPKGADEIWQQRLSTVRNAGSLAPLADATVERWLTDAFKAKHPGRWRQIRDTVTGTSSAGYLGC